MSKGPVREPTEPCGGGGICMLDGCGLDGGRAGGGCICVEDWLCCGLSTGLRSYRGSLPVGGTWLWKLTKWSSRSLALSMA